MRTPISAIHFSRKFFIFIFTVEYMKCLWHFIGCALAACDNNIIFSTKAHSIVPVWSMMRKYTCSSERLSGEREKSCAEKCLIKWYFHYLLHCIDVTVHKQYGAHRKFVVSQSTKCLLLIFQTNDSLFQYLMFIVLLRSNTKKKIISVWARLGSVIDIWWTMRSK